MKILLRALGSLATVFGGALLGQAIFLFLVLSATTLWADEERAAQEAASSTPSAGPVSDVEAGKKIYQKRCIFCHGVEGAGDGPASERLMPKPRDFTMGLFKYRTTTSGKLPTDDDLFKVITHGLPGTGMPKWDDLLTELQRRQVIQYIKTFSKKFERQKGPLEMVTVGTEIPSSKESIEKGRALFMELECFKCHGNEGRGDGPSALELTDDKGDVIRPRNFTKNWFFRGGGEAKDIYMRINTGLDGTPMPSFKDSMDNEKSWHVANFVRSLSPPKHPELNPVIKARKVNEEIPSDPNASAWQEGESNWFPTVGQVIREPRHFTPTVSDVRVKSLYNEKEIGMMVIWDDPSHSQKNEEMATLEDAVAIQFPVELYPGSKKPYFLMGDAKSPVNLWTWKTESNTFTESNANGIDKEVSQPQGGQGVTGSGVYKDGQYKVVMKRLLKTDDPQHDLQVSEGKFIPVAFHVWDGTNGETLTKRAISHWYYVLLAPPIAKTVYVYPSIVAGVVFGIQLLIRKRLRKGEQKTKP